MIKRSIQFSSILSLGCVANLAFAQGYDEPPTPPTPPTPPSHSTPAAPAAETPAADSAPPTTAPPTAETTAPTAPDPGNVTDPEPTVGETQQDASSYGYGMAPKEPEVPTAAQEATEAARFEFGGDTWKLKFSGQYRPRVWVSTHPTRDLEKDEFSWLINQRARLGASLASGDGVEFFIQMQDVRIWGEEEDTLGTFSAAGLDAHQAYGFFPVTDEFSLKIGRQEIVLDNSRLVGNVGWTQRARSFDSGRAFFKVENFQIQALYSKVRETTIYPDGHVPTDRDGDADFGGGQASLDFAKGEGGNGSRVAALYLVNALHDTLNEWRDQTRQTIGGIATGKYSGFQYSAEGYYQFGNQNYDEGAFVDQSISAFLVAGLLGYTINIGGTPGIAAWGEYLSGDADGKPTGAFDTLYATNHKFYGFMDMFLNVPLQTRNLGLFDAGGRISFGPIEEKFWGQVDFHHFRTAKADPYNNQTLGNEIDFVLNYAFTKNLSMQGVWTVFFPDAAMGFTTGGLPPDADLKTQQLGYFTLDFKI